MFNKADFNRLKKIVDKNCRHKILREINECDDCYLASDGYRIGVLFKCELNNIYDESIIGTLKSLIKDYKRELNQSITVDRKILLTTLKEKYKELTEKLFNETGEESYKDNVIIKFNINYDEYCMDIILVYIGSASGKEVVTDWFKTNIDYKKDFEGNFEFNLKYNFFEDYLNFFKGRYLEIKYIDNPRQPILSKTEDRLMLLYPFARKKTLDDDE